MKKVASQENRKMLFILLCSTAGVLSGAENVHAENSVEKSIAVGRSCFYHFNDLTLSRKFRVLTNSEIISENGSNGTNSIISI